VKVQPSVNLMGRGRIHAKNVEVHPCVNMGSGRIHALNANLKLHVSRVNLWFRSEGLVTFPTVLVVSSISTRMRRFHLVSKQRNYSCVMV
jgi:hypothetical protein